MVESVGAPAPVPVPPLTVQLPRWSWQSYVLAGALRSVGRPLGNVWPHSPRALRAVDDLLERAVAVSARSARSSIPGTSERVDAAGVPALLVRAASVTTPRRTIVHFHGGGFVFGTMKMYREFALRLSASADAEVLLFDYRHPPQVDVATMVADCLAVYRWALAEHTTGEFVISGDSAGGNLGIGTVVVARDAGLALPSAIVTQSAWFDLGYRHPRGARRDAFFSTMFAARSVRILAAGGDMPASVLPLEMDLTALPPVLLQVGADEPLADGNVRMATALGMCGVAAEVQLWAGQVHDFQAFGGFLPEARRALTEIATFMNDVSKSPESERSPRSR